MSKIVGKRWTVYQGNEVQVPFTCCEEAADVIRNGRESAKAIQTMRSILSPPIAYGYTKIEIVGVPPSSFALNYCPTCGDKYKEEKKA